VAEAEKKYFSGVFFQRIFASPAKKSRDKFFEISSFRKEILKKRKIKFGGK
jgi:hypothetical protein